MIVRAGRILRTGLACLGALMALVTLAPPRWYAWWLAGEWYQPKKGTLIVLGGDSPGEGLLGLTSYWRSVNALIAWREGQFERVVLSGESGTTEPMRMFLTAGGVPAGAILIEGRSTSTRQNALFTAELARSVPGPYVLLTSDYHMWRARRAFEKAGLAVIPRPFPDALKLFNDWRWRWQIFIMLVQESGKIVYYEVRGWI